MTKLVTIGVACAALFAGATAASATPHEGDHPNNGNLGSSAAAKLCAASKKADHGAFKAVWSKHAMRDCIRANRGTEPSAVEDATSDFVNAAQDCRAQRDADPVVFEAAWGTNVNHRNAFGKCVSQTAHEHQDEGGAA